MTPSPPSTLPTDTRLDLIDRAREAVLHARQEVPTPWLDPMIERSWRRCLSQGFEPDRRVEFDAVGPGAQRRALDASQPLLQAAGPVIQSLARAMLHTRYFAMLTDARGTVIEVSGPVDRQNPHAAAIARVGVDLSEAAVGTTAIGTTLAEQQSVWLHRGEHFFRDTSVFSCAGAPIRGPLGECVGMLDLTGVDVAEQPALRHLVTQAARGIENAMVLAAPHRLLLRLNWPGRVLGDDTDGLVCLDGDGRVTALNRSAAEMLSVRPRLGQQPGHAADLFAVPFDTLFDAARQQRGSLEVPLWSGLRIQVLARQPDMARGRTHAASAGSGQGGVPLRDLETSLIRKAVADARGNVMEAARALGISRATVYRKLRGPR
ncbi:helix-turn-helix domain-containing protein [Hydrogenophaga sp. NFH-34]|uniref:helix-turn-helix domain-containing protein n=1 Tax=Hydrogenophaga sp. NFH-34 TaxID=2744446 RepID=UPI001F485DD0|nr:helix-turn-helix domain-containing protein [Hydrogenophaga sp. NFH-34]